VPRVRTYAGVGSARSPEIGPGEEPLIALMAASVERRRVTLPHPDWVIHRPP
jgi:hypothetical protein